MPNVRSHEQSQVITMRVSPEERAALDALARETGTSLTAVVREALRPQLAPLMPKSA